MGPCGIRLSRTFHGIHGNVALVMDLGVELTIQYVAAQSSCTWLQLRPYPLIQPDHLKPTPLCLSINIHRPILFKHMCQKNLVCRTFLKQKLHQLSRCGNHQALRPRRHPRLRSEPPQSCRKVRLSPSPTCDAEADQPATLSSNVKCS